MRARPRLGALGLRGRIVGAMLITAVAALVVAAVALLGPLESSLQSADLTTLKREVQAKSSTYGSFVRANPGLAIFYRPSAPKTGPKQPPLSRKDAHLGTSVPASPSQQAIAQQQKTELETGTVAHNELLRLEDGLAERIGASEVALLGYAEPSGHRARVIVASPGEDLSEADLFDDAPKAFRSKVARYSLGSIKGVQYVRAAIPFTTPAVVLAPRGGRRVTVPSQRWVLAVRKPMDEVSSAVSAVRTAFFVAALVALVLTILLGIPLSARLVRRLRRLRQAALQLAEGGPAVEIPFERARDEVADLARTFALMQTRLHQQEEARRAFVATASHELRTPLATLDGMLELLDEDLQRGSFDLDDAQLLLESARVQSRRLGQLAADLLDLSRLDAQVQLRSEPVELGELARAVLAEFEIGTTDRRIATVLDDRAGAVWALGDPGSVARIVRILLDNAVRLSPEGSEVTIELLGGEHASLVVRDEGPGVPPDERELIFERFKRGRDTAGSAGFGLGLAIGRELAERMGGELVLDLDQTPGAAFTLRLPVAHAPDKEPVAVP